jgi:hypothetical protein
LVVVQHVDCVANALLGDHSPVDWGDVEVVVVVEEFQLADEAFDGDLEERVDIVGSGEIEVEIVELKELEGGVLAGVGPRLVV